MCIRDSLEIAKLLDYQPNKAGVALAAQKKHFKIGVLLFSKENPFFDDVFEGLYEKLEELSVYGCSITKRQIPFDLNMQLTAIDDFLQEGIHGLILSPYDDISVCLLYTSIMCKLHICPTDHLYRFHDLICLFLQTFLTLL